METVIVAAGRTPFGAFQGSLASVPAPELAAAVIRRLTEQTGVAGEDIAQAFIGNVLSAGIGQAPARQAVIRAGLGDGVPAVTLNKMCGSGMEAIIQAARFIGTGEGKVALAGGMESMSNAPYLLPGARAGLRLGDASVVDSLVHDGLTDAYGGKHMGACAEMCASRYSFTREQQDAFAARSFTRAREAAAAGRFGPEIVPVEVSGRRGQVTVVTEDEGPAKADLQRMPDLRPAFAKDGTITAANASSINDGAAMTLLMERGEAAARGLEPLGIIRGWAVHAHEPEWFTTAPVSAVRKLLERLGWTAGSVDMWEINEAFSVVTMAAMTDLELDAEKVNVNGGAVALGHPIGASGARIVTALLNALRQTGGRRGVAAICIGGGEALALAVETP